MAKTIGTAVFEEVRHEKCGKGIGRVINGVLHVECVRKGCREWVPLPDWVKRDELGQAIGLLLSGKVSPSRVLALADPLLPYYIERLIVIGPQEIEKAFLGPNGENPLGLSPGWCPRVPLPETWTPENLKRLAELCQTEEWNTTPILYLALPEVAGRPTSLVSQYDWYGVAHDGLGPGKIRQDIMWSNWSVKKQEQLVTPPAVPQPTWKIGYELPYWSTKLNWENQQKAAQERGLTIATAPGDAWMLNLVAVVTGEKLRRYTSARTATICVGCPLFVYFYEESLYVDRDWNPGDASGYLGLAAEGVPTELGF